LEGWCRWGNFTKLGRVNGRWLLVLWDQFETLRGRVSINSPLQSNGDIRTTHHFALIFVASLSLSRCFWWQSSRFVDRFCTTTSAPKQKSVKSPVRPNK
jgi:hypothetical protein